MDSTYEGEMFFKKRYGQGHFKKFYKHNSKLLKFEYKGAWSNDRMHGHGISKLFDLNGYITATYTGNWQFGKRHGQGKLINHATGQEFEGNWYNDQLNDKETSKITTRLLEPQVNPILIQNEIQVSSIDDEVRPVNELPIISIYKGQVLNNKKEGRGVLAFMHKNNHNDLKENPDDIQ